MHKRIWNYERKEIHGLEGATQQASPTRAKSSELYWSEAHKSDILHSAHISIRKDCCTCGKGSQATAFSRENKNKMPPYLNGKSRLPPLWAYDGYSWWETKPVQSNRTNRHTCKFTPSPSSSAYMHHLYVAAATEPTQVQRSDYKRLNEVKRARAALEAERPLSLTLRGEWLWSAWESGVKEEAKLQEVLTFIAPKAAEIQW